MTPRRRSRDLDDDDLNMSVAKTYLTPPGLSYEMPLNDASFSASGGGEVIKIPRATSMHEMNIIHDMVQFDEEMDALDGERVNQDQGDDDDDGFFIDSSDRDTIQPEEEEAKLNLDGRYLGLSTSPDSVIDMPTPAARNGGGMRRVMSVASLSSASQRQKFNLSALQNISEEGEDTLNINRVKLEPVKVETRSDPIKVKARSDSLGDSNHSDSTPSDGTPQIICNRRRPSRHRTPSGGMPRRSSLKGSMNNLRSSLKSSGSSRSLDPLGDSNHSVSYSSDNNDAQTLNNRRRSSRHRTPSGGMPSRSSLKGSSGSLRSSLKSNGSNLDDTNHSIESNVDNSMKRNVSFSSLEIRSYNVTLGDAPTQYGPPVSLDWEYDPSATQEYQVDSYEDYRTNKEPRRNKQEMLMPANHRQYLLMREAGFSRHEIGLAMEEAKRVAKQRQKTVKGIKLGLQPVEEVLEKARKTFFGGWKGGKSGRKK